MEGKIVTAIAVLAFFVIIGIFILRKPAILDREENSMKKDVVTKFLGGELYEISLRQLEDFVRLYRTNPAAELEGRTKDFIRLALGSQIAQQLDEDDLEYLIQRNQLFSVDEVVSRIDLDPLIPEIIQFMKEERIPTYIGREPIPVIVGVSVFFVEGETIKLFDRLKARMIEKDFSLENRNA